MSSLKPAYQECKTSLVTLGRSDEAKSQLLSHLLALKLNGKGAGLKNLTIKNNKNHKFLHLVTPAFVLLPLVVGRGATLQSTYLLFKIGV